MDTWMDGWTNGQMVRWTDGEMDNMKRKTDGWMDGQTDRPTSGAGVFPLEQLWDQGGALGVMLITRQPSAACCSWAVAAVLL